MVQIAAWGVIFPTGMVLGVCYSLQIGLEEHSVLAFTHRSFGQDGTFLFKFLEHRSP